MWTLGYWIHERLEGVLFQPVATILFWIGKQMQRHLAFNSTWYNLLPSSSTANMQNNHEVIFEWYFLFIYPTFIPYFFNTF